MHARKRPTTPIEKSRELQRRLYLAAKRNRGRRFHALYDRIFRPDVLWRAWVEVRRNGGAAGLDGITIEDVEREGVKEFLRQISQDLRKGRYRPRPVRRVYIPKPDGQKRPLGLPTVRDRVVQQACKIVIEPIFESHFQDCSYGFRPKRSAAQAVNELKRALVTGWWVVEVDIKSYFDNINHEVLMSLLKRRICDRRVLKLIRQWLKSGVMEDGSRYATEIGSPQGGVISPLLANIYLHVLDMYWKDNHSHLGRLFRYADDLVIVCRDRWSAVSSLKAVRYIMNRLKLTLHSGKTRVVNLKQSGFDFLGFHFRKSKSSRSGKISPYNWPSPKAMKSAREKIREITMRKRLSNSAEEVVKYLNSVVRGWRNYFKIGNSTKKFQELDHYLKFRLWKWLRWRRGPRGSLSTNRFKALLRNLGVESFYNQGICSVMT